MGERFLVALTIVLFIGDRASCDGSLGEVSGVAYRTSSEVLLLARTISVWGGR